MLGRANPPGRQPGQRHSIRKVDWTKRAGGSHGVHREINMDHWLFSRTPPHHHFSLPLGGEPRPTVQSNAFYHTRSCSCPLSVFSLRLCSGVARDAHSGSIYDSLPKHKTAHSNTLGGKTANKYSFGLASWLHGEATGAGAGHRGSELASPQWAAPLGSSDGRETLPHHPQPWCPEGTSLVIGGLGDTSPR